MEFAGEVNEIEVAWRLKQGMLGVQTRINNL
jgi:hypothetical protein